MKRLLENINKAFNQIVKFILELFTFFKKYLPILWRELKLLWIRIKDLKDFSILVSWPNHLSKTYNIKKLILYGFFYTVICFVIFSIFVYITPLNNYLTKEKVIFNQKDVENLNALNNRITNLLVELEKVKSYNNRLKYALQLGDSTIFDSSQIQIKPVKRLKASGSLYEIIRYWLFTPESQQESYYFTKPAEGFLSKGFDSEKGHLGIDFALKQGSPVYSTGNGFVIFADYTANDGFMIIVNHSNDFISIYKHCSSLLKKVRDKVVQGEVIALSGNTGENTSGPHLHFELWKKGLPIDPAKYLLIK